MSPFASATAQEAERDLMGRRFEVASGLSGGTAIIPPESTEHDRAASGPDLLAPVTGELPA